GWASGLGHHTEDRHGRFHPAAWGLGVCRGWHGAVIRGAPRARALCLLRAPLRPATACVRGGEHLLAAARDVGDRALRGPKLRLSEADPPHTAAYTATPYRRRKLRSTLQAIQNLEMTAGQAEVGGTVLRYGGFYGPDTGALDGGPSEQIAHRRLPRDRQWPRRGRDGGEGSRSWRRGFADKSWRQGICGAVADANPQILTRRGGGRGVG